MLYRKVKISERIPSKDGEYITNIGWLQYSKERGFRLGTITKHLDITQNRIEYWLEEVIRITDEQIKDIAFKEFPVNDFERKYRAIFTMGIKKAIEILNNK